MAKTTDPASLLKEFMGNYSLDTSVFEDAFKNSAELGEKLSSIVLEAAGESSSLSAKWTEDTISKLSEVTKAKTDPASYAKAMSEFAAAEANSVASQMSAFAELAKKVQMETIEVLTSAGREAAEDAASSFKKATDEAVKAATAKKK